MKENVKKLLKELVVPYEDLGNGTYDPSDDFTEFGKAVAEKIAAKPEEHRGILICRTGFGMDIIANKYPGVRCTLPFNITLARLSRLHEDANVLALAGEHLPEDIARDIVKAWLETPFSGEERYRRRLESIAELEKGAEPQRPPSRNTVKKRGSRNKDQGQQAS